MLNGIITAARVAAPIIAKSVIGILVAQLVIGILDWSAVRARRVLAWGLDRARRAMARVAGRAMSHVPVVVVVRTER